MKKRQHNKKNHQQTDQIVSVSDVLDEDILQQLDIAKKQLTAEAKKEEAQRQAKLRQKRKEREKNKTMEEWLEEYGDITSKYS